MDMLNIQKSQELIRSNNDFLKNIKNIIVKNAQTGQDIYANISTDDLNKFHRLNNFKYYVLTNSSTTMKTFDNGAKAYEYARDFMDMKETGQAVVLNDQGVIIHELYQPYENALIDLGIGINLADQLSNIFDNYGIDDIGAMSMVTQWLKSKKVNDGVNGD